MASTAEQLPLHKRHHANVPTIGCSCPFDQPGQPVCNAQTNIIRSGSVLGLHDADDHPNRLILRGLSDCASKGGNRAPRYPGDEAQAFMDA